MKKTLITIFSISITAGTIYYGYSKFKEFTIKKLVSTWTKSQDNNSGGLTKEQQDKLKAELEKLFIWEIRLLVLLTAKIQSNSSEPDKATLGKKLVEKKIFQKADLSDVEGFLEYKKYTN